MIEMEKMQFSNIIVRFSAFALLFLKLKISQAITNKLKNSKKENDQKVLLWLVQIKIQA